jgi:hypothetical protein
MESERKPIANRTQSDCKSIVQRLQSERKANSNQTQSERKANTKRTQYNNNNKAITMRPQYKKKSKTATKDMHAPAFRNWLTRRCPSWTASSRSSPPSRERTAFVNESGYRQILREDEGRRRGDGLAFLPNMLYFHVRLQIAQQSQVLTTPDTFPAAPPCPPGCCWALPKPGPCLRPSTRAARGAFGSRRKSRGLHAVTRCCELEWVRVSELE